MLPPDFCNIFLFSKIAFKMLRGSGTCLVLALRVKIEFVCITGPYVIRARPKQYTVLPVRFVFVDKGPGGNLG